MTSRFRRRATAWQNGSLTALALALMPGAAWAQSETTALPPGTAVPSAGTSAPSPSTAAPQAETVHSPEASAGAPATESGVGDIVVTAQFRAQRLQDTPIAITAVNASMMEARSQTNLTQISDAAPNVTIRQSNPSYGPTAAVSIRGIGQFDNQFAYEPGVAIYVDDVYYPTVFGAQFDLLDLDRVEILRGPQGTLAGKNSIGGAVKLYSKRPTGSGQGYIEATGGSYGRLDLRASADVPLVQDLLALRLSGVYKSGGGFVDRIDFACRYPGTYNLPNRGHDGCKLGTLGGTEFKGARAYLAFTPGDKLEVNVIGEWTKDQSPAAPAVIASVNNAALSPVAAGVNLNALLQGGRYVNYGTWDDLEKGITVPVNNNANNWGVSGQVLYHLNDDISLTSITAYRSYGARYGLDVDESPFGFATQNFHLTFHSFSQELRLSGKALDNKLNYTFGGYYYDAHGTYFSLIDFYRPANNTYEGPTKVPSDSKSIFAHLEFAPIANLTLSGGARYTKESKDLTFNNTSLLTLPFSLAPLNGQKFHYAYDRVDWRASAEYRLSNQIMVYGSVSTGFKGGGINPRAYYVVQVVPFGPEKLTAYEIGTKLDLFGRKVRLNLSGFINKYDNIQLILNQAYKGTTPASVPINAGKADVKGAEAEFSARPVDGLLIDASLSFLDFKYTYLAPEAIASLINYSMVSPFNPRWKASGGIQYEIPSGRLGSFTPRLDFVYQSEIWSNATNRETNRSNGYKVFNGRITWKLPNDRVEIAGAVTNLFDNYYKVNRYDNLIATAGTTLYTLGRPREWQISAKYKF